MSNPFADALNNILNKDGTRSSAAVSGITRTRITSQATKLHRAMVLNDVTTNGATTVAFWSLDDSATSASGSGGAAVIGQFINNSTAAANNQPYMMTFTPPIQFDTGLTFNYTATGTGTNLRYSFWFS